MPTGRSLARRQAKLASFNFGHDDHPGTNGIVTDGKKRKPISLRAAAEAAHAEAGSQCAGFDPPSIDRGSGLTNDELCDRNLRDRQRAQGE